MSGHDTIAVGANTHNLFFDLTSDTYEWWDYVLSGFTEGLMMNQFFDTRSS